jgi:hypothetical protein
MAGIENTDGLKFGLVPMTLKLAHSAIFCILTSVTYPKILSLSHGSLASGLTVFASASSG